MSFLSKSAVGWSPHMTFSSCIDSKACMCAEFLFPSNKSMWYFTKVDNWKRSGQQRWKWNKETKRTKSDDVESEHKIKHNEVIEEIAHSGNAAIVAKRL